MAIKKATVPDYKHNELKLFFSGKDWDRKGGDIAVDAAEYLNKMVNIFIKLVMGDRRIRSE